MNRNILRECERIAKDKAKSHPEFTNFIHYCFIVQDNKIVEWGMNRRHTPLINPEYPRKLHAEEDAAKKAKGVLNKNKPWEAVNIRISRQSVLRISKPCKYCEVWLRLFGCSKVWYSTDDGFEKYHLS